MSDFEEFVSEKGYVWPYGVCALGKSENSLACDIDGVIEFSSDIEGEPVIEKECPLCGAELEIKYRFKISEKVEELPENIREFIEGEFA